MTAVESVALSAVVAGVLDISATGTLMRAQGVAFRRLLQGIASGLLGRTAFEGSTATPALGLALHFLIAAVWAAFYWAAARRWGVLWDRPVLWGALFGMVVHLVMSRVVLPLSRAPKRPFAKKAFVTQLIIHVLCVGLPIALTQSYLRG